MDHSYDAAAIIFPIVMNVWRNLDIREGCGHLATTCKLLCRYLISSSWTYLTIKNRLTREFIEDYGKSFAKQAVRASIYKCKNIMITNRDEFSCLSHMLHHHFPYSIHSLHLRLATFNQELVNSDLVAIGAIMANQPPFTLTLEYNANTDPSTPATFTIPDNIESFSFALFSGDIKIYTSPSSKLQLFKFRGQAQISGLHLPPLKTLIGVNFALDLGAFPQLTEIHFPKMFGGDVTALATLNNLEVLCFALTGRFNRPLDNLPSSLKRLEVGGGLYSHPLHNLPPELHTLIVVVGKYDHPFDHLPQRLQHLEVSVSINYSHKFDSLPNSLKTLLTQCHQPFKLITRIPTQLVYLTIVFRSKDKQPIQCPLPGTLQLLRLCGCTNSFNTLPARILTLDMGGMSELELPPIETVHNISHTIINQLPALIHTLILPAFLNIPFSSSVSLPHLRVIEFGAKFNQRINQLPATLEFIRFNAKSSTLIEFDQPLENLPPNLKELVFDGNSVFNQPLTRPLPGTLKVIQFIGTNSPEG